MFVSNESEDEPDATPDATLEQLRELDIDGMSPRDAMETLYRLKELAQKRKKVG